MSPEAAAQPLTVQERILLHLLPFQRARDAYAVPKEVTQAGIAGAVGIRVAHASREVRKLVESNLVEERDAAVEGAKRHQKAYFLTPSGAQTTLKMKQDFAGAVPPLLAAPAGSARPQGPVTVERELPEPRYFFGRLEELQAARKILEARAVLVLLGIAGIGKSTFGAKLFDEVKRTRSVVWTAVHEYDAPASVLAPVARLLASLGRPKLELMLKREAAVNLARAREALLQDVVGLDLTAFFDDAQAATPEALQALRVLREVASERPKDFKLVLLARNRPPIYDARDLMLRKTVGELELHGLAPPDVAALIDVAERKLDPALVYEVTGGHPLFTELLRDSADPAIGSGLDRRQIDRFVEEQIFSKLDAGEREALRRIVFHRRPVDARVVLAPPASMESMLTLEARSLVRRDARGRVLAHESVRDFVRRTLTEEEERAYAQSAYRGLLKEVEEADRRNDAAYAISILEDALTLAPDDDQVVYVLTKLGLLHQALAQYNQAVARLEEAVNILGRHKWSPALGLALYHLGATHSEAGHAEIAKKYLEEAAALSEKGLATLDPERGGIYLERAKWELRYGTAQAARPWIEKGRKVGDALGHDFLNAEAEMLHSHITPPRESAEHLERAIAIAKRKEFTPFLSLAHTTYAWHTVDWFGDTKTALRHGEEGLRLAKVIGNRVLIGGARAALAKARWREGDCARAMEDARLGMETAEKSFTERIVPMALLATLATETGDAATGEQMARELLQAAERYGTPVEVLAARRALARSLDVQGRYDEAVPLLESCHEVYARMGLTCDGPNHIATLDRLIRMEVARGHGARAAHWYGVAEPWLKGLDTPIGQALGHMAYAHLRQLEAPAQAASRYWQAAQIWRQLGWRLLELKMLVDCVNAVNHAEAEQESVPEDVPAIDALESRVAELTSQLNVPRPSPVHGTSSA